MKPERMAVLVAWWVRFYTRNLSTSIARRRVEEIDADLQDHIAHERAQGSSDRRIALSILSRMVRGLAADASWRSRHAEHRSLKTRSAAHRSVVRVSLVTASILLLPLVAMQFSTEVVWGPADFLVAGALLGATGLALDLALTSGRSVAYRAAAGLALAAALFLVWAGLAVGIIGETGDPADLMYAGVLAVGMIGAIVARFRPHGMARTLLVVAFAQALVAAIALIAGKHHDPVSSFTEIARVNALFVALFIGSAGLFRLAARRQPPTDAAPEG